MAVRTAYDAVAGTILTATNLDRYPGGWIGYAEVTAGQAGITVTTDITSLTVTVTVGTTRRLHIGGLVRVDSSAVATSEAYVMEASTKVGTATASQTAGGAITHLPQAVRTPSSGSNTYKLAAGTSAGTIATVASATQPAFILVQDIGPA